ncbi:hypothetical protein ACLOJK_000619 [Asimina triloba]
MAVKLGLIHIFRGRRLLLNDEVASPDHSDVHTRSVTARGPTETPHAAAQRYLMPTGPAIGSGYGPATGPREAPPVTRIKIPRKLKHINSLIQMLPN